MQPPCMWTWDGTDWLSCVCMQVPRRFASQQAGKMSYEDFVWFILCEEDKASDTALEYWFRYAQDKVISRVGSTP